MPILAGATLRDRLIACLGAALGVGLTGFICVLATGHDGHIPAIAGPIGASALLLFAIPASPLAQPWPIIAGNTISAAIGVMTAFLIHEPALAVGVAVGLSIAAMSLTRSLHPPGGAMALTAALLGPPATAAAWLFPIMPVLANSILLVALGWVFHRFTRHSYPHVPADAPQNRHGTADAPSQVRVGFSANDIDAALAAAGETFDIDRADLDRLLRQVERNALKRTHGALTCDAIMSRDVISVPFDASATTARDLLIRHNVRSLPVIAADGRLAGTVGLRDLVRRGDAIAEVMTPAATARPETPAVALVGPLTDGKTHAVIVVDLAGRVAGLISQTDLLAALARALAAKAA
ncbi:hypothetical protein sos41_01570 [Alphaproteobacteria bacterium SO-S41]|nr:hypothetical protein sos41_01570 [Alphaproteobacteria bacterium SO-S41]